MSGLDEALPGIRRAKKRRIIEPSDANEWAGCASRDACKTAIASLATERGNCVAARRRECRCIIAWSAAGGVAGRLEIADNRAFHSSVATSRRAHAQLSARQ